MQISCRDRNRIAIQGDVLGARAMGVANVLLPDRRRRAVRRPSGGKACVRPRQHRAYPDRRDHAGTRAGSFGAARRSATPPELFIGAAENPFAPPLDFRRCGSPRRSPRAPVHPDPVPPLLPMLMRFMTGVRDLGLIEHCFVLVVGVDRSPRPPPGHALDPQARTGRASRTR